MQICEGLAALHEKGVVHRDLKPSNVLLDEERNAKIADLGIAKQADSGNRFTTTGEVAGTYEYMAPEHISAPDAVNPRADVYAVGIILYDQR